LKTDISVKIRVFADSPLKTVILGCKNGAKIRIRSCRSRKSYNPGGLVVVVSSTYCRRVDFARRQGRKNERTVQGSVGFCVFSRLHCYRDLEHEICDFKASWLCGLGLQIWPGTREKEIEFEREREREREIPARQKTRAALACFGNANSISQALQSQMTGIRVFGAKNSGNSSDFGGNPMSS
jgi:hypothetical protein